MNFLCDPNLKVKKYNDFTELHKSTVPPEMWQKIINREIAPMKINVYRVGDKIEQIHVVFDGGNVQNGDFYIYGRALQDYLDLAKKS